MKRDPLAPCPCPTQTTVRQKASNLSRWFGLMLAVGVGMRVLAATDARDYSVLVSARVQSSPPQIALQWPQDTFALPANYIISRKSPGQSAWVQLGTLSGNETNFTDTAVAPNVAYEYQVEKNAADYVGYGYVLAGIEAPLIEWRGKVILLVDATQAGGLAGELERLRADLIGDGWQVIRHDVSRDDSPPNIKALIRADYAADPANVRSVILLGHVPVPYAGDLAPDGHTPGHQGAWPADVYYADMGVEWPDVSVTSTNATEARNQNRPGDGKFDPSSLSAAVALEVGRVDLANLPSFTLSETELLRRYLNKDHNFRHRIISAAPRGLITDNFGVFYGSAFAASGWRNFAACFGAEHVVATNQWFAALAGQSYLWAYACGGGSYTSIGGVGTTADFAAHDPQAVFLFLFGSYFGDWDSRDNVMRAALATPSYTLASAWAGRPHWFVHRMALGETLGHCTRLSQNNSTADGGFRQINAGSQQIHVALMGDPTLRLHPVAPPTEVTVTAGVGEATLAWTAAADEVLGYYLYRAPDLNSPFERITPFLITGNSYTDTALVAGHYVYMVRAVKLQKSASGSYYNASQGAFASVQVVNSALLISPAENWTVECGEPWTFNTPVASGGCGLIDLRLSSAETNLTCGNCYVATRTWVATDACGQTVSTAQVMSVQDTKAPQLSGVINRIVEPDSVWNFDTPTAEDAGGEVTIAIVGTVTNGNVFTRTWQATDACGNASRISQSVTVGKAGPPIVGIVATRASVEEGIGTAAFRISRTGGNAESLTVHLAFSGSAKNGTDYAKLPNIAVIPAGTSEVDVTVVALTDDKKEQSESVTATLRPAKAYELGAQTQATVLIVNGAPVGKRLGRPAGQSQAEIESAL